MGLAGHVARMRERCIQRFCVETCREETIWKTYDERLIMDLQEAGWRSWVELGLD